MKQKSPQPKQEITPAFLKEIKQQSNGCRNTIVDMLTAANSSHLGCSFSIIDVLTILYHVFLDTEKIKSQDPTRDYFVLSKGHAAAALYAALHSVGIIPKDMIDVYHHDETLLGGHPVRNLAFGIEASTGSLGQGLPMAVGLALSAKHKNLPSRVYVLVGDGECQEGSIWEAVTVASRFKLNNLTIVVDYNNLQGYNRTEDIMTGSLAEKFKAFGCNTHTVDGHDHNLIINTIMSCGRNDGPDVIIAKTTKGKGLSFIEDKLEWHYRSLKPDQYKKAKQELENLCCGD
jgi:transketolase